jgi:hypothetical protein
MPPILGAGKRENAAMSGNVGGILKEKTGYAKGRSKDIVNILPGHSSFRFDRRTIMKRKVLLAGIVGALLLLGMVFAVTGCDSGSSGGGYNYSFINGSSYDVSVVIDLSSVSLTTPSTTFTLRPGATRNIQLPVTSLSFSYTPYSTVRHEVSSSVTGATVTFTNRY